MGVGVSLDALPDLTDADRASIRVDSRTKRLLTPAPRVQQHIAAWKAYGQRLRANGRHGKSALAVSRACRVLSS